LDNPNATHIEDGDNVVSSHPGYVTPDSQSGSLCTGSDTVWVVS